MQLPDAPELVKTAAGKETMQTRKLTTYTGPTKGLWCKSGKNSTARHKTKYLIITDAVNREVMQTKTTHANEIKPKKRCMKLPLQQKCSKPAGGAVSGTAH